MGERWLYREAVQAEAEPEPSPEETAAKELLAGELLSCLTPLQRETVELVVMNGVPNHIAAQLLGCRPNTVDKRLERARRRMEQHAAAIIRRHES